MVSVSGLSLVYILFTNTFYLVLEMIFLIHVELGGCCPINPPTINATPPDVSRGM